MRPAFAQALAIQLDPHLDRITDIFGNSFSIVLRHVFQELQIFRIQVQCVPYPGHLLFVNHMGIYHAYMIAQRLYVVKSSLTTYVCCARMCVCSQ